MTISKLPFSTLALAIAAGSAINAGAAERPTLTLSPERPSFHGLHYARALALIDQYRTIAYGEPIQIQANIEARGIDLRTFDDFVVTVDAAELMAAPNRGEGDGP